MSKEILDHIIDAERNMLSFRVFDPENVSEDLGAYNKLLASLKAEKSLKRLLCNSIKICNYDPDNYDHAVKETCAFPVIKSCVRFYLDADRNETDYNEHFKKFLDKPFEECCINGGMIEPKFIMHYYHKTPGPTVKPVVKNIIYFTYQVESNCQDKVSDTELTYADMQEMLKSDSDYIKEYTASFHDIFLREANKFNKLNGSSVVYTDVKDIHLEATREQYARPIIRYQKEFYEISVNLDLVFTPVYVDTFISPDLKPRTADEFFADIGNHYKDGCINDPQCALDFKEYYKECYIVKPSSASFKNSRLIREKDHDVDINDLLNGIKTLSSFSARYYGRGMSTVLDTDEFLNLLGDAVPAFNKIDRNWLESKQLPQESSSTDKYGIMIKSINNMTMLNREKLQESLDTIQANLERELTNIKLLKEAFDELTEKFKFEGSAAEKNKLKNYYERAMKAALSADPLKYEGSGYGTALNQAVKKLLN